jgi:hypothetical protein
MPRLYSLFLIFILCIAGCVPVDSLNPFFSDRNVISDPGLVGLWRNADPNQETEIRFDPGENNAYQMILMQKESGSVKESVFTAHLINLGGEKFFDVELGQISGASQHLFHTDPVKKGSRFEPTLEPIGDGAYLEVLGPTPGKGNSQEVQIKVRPSHWICKVYLTSTDISIQYLDREWVKEQIDKKLIQARSLKASDSSGSQNWVLSGSTAELEQFVVHHADDPGAFDNGISLKKVSTAKSEGEKSERR